MQAGLICRFIEEHYGTGKLAAMLAAWREGSESPELIEQVLGVSGKAFDKAFAASIDAEFGTLLAALDDWGKKKSQLDQQAANREWAAAESTARELIAMMPAYVTPNSPYLILAKAQRELGKADAARETLKSFWQRGGYEPGALATLARELSEQGDSKTALAVYDSINLVEPLDADLHGEFGELLLADGQAAKALREFEVALALAPHDMATAWFRMAEARAALAAQDAVGNFIGTLSIFTDRPFKVGDWIIVGDKVDGNVEQIGFRSTKVRTWPKTLMSIPNQVLATEIVDNWSRMPKRRVKMTVGVTYSTTADQMEELLRRIRQLLKDDEGVDSDFFLVRFTDFGSSSLDIFLYYFTRSIKWDQHLAVRERVNLNIMRTIREMGLSIAFPTRSIYVESMPPGLSMGTSKSRSDQ